jgi:FkbM family methyltransferase
MLNLSRRALPTALEELHSSNWKALMVMTLGQAQVERLFALHAAENAFETLIRSLYESWLHEGDWAIDGGAHGGLHTLPMAAAVGAGGRVLAFEPPPNICQWLRNVCAGIANVEVREEALGREAGYVTFYAAATSPVLSGLRARPIPDETFDEVKVRMTTMDTFASRPVRFIKLDLEGGELHALQGGSKLLRAQRPLIAFECGRQDAASAYGYTAEHFFSFFGSHGYRLVDLFGRPFGRVDFQEPWNSVLVPHYCVASPEECVDTAAELCGAAARALIQCS